MSQYPPGPPPPPPQQNYPPQGYPPAPPPGQGFPPPGQSYGYPPQPRGSNGAAIASLIMGILLCIPVITGLGAIITGFVGSKKANDPRFGGKGMAVTGIILGFLNLIGWGIAGGLMYVGYQQLKPVIAMGNDFVAAMAEGNIDKAAGYTHSMMNRADLQRAAEQMKPWGKLKDTTFTQFKRHMDTTGDRLELGGTATFDKATKKVRILLTQEAGQWKIVEFNFPP